MRGRMMGWTVVVAVLALAVTARASHQAGELDRNGLNEAAKENKALARYITLNGYPDMAEVKTIIDQPPWDDHEVTLYYVKNRKEISFARARVLGRPTVYSTRYERVMTDSDIRAVKTNGSKLAASKSAPTTEASAAATPVAAVDAAPCKGSASKRAACAAGRAENAAERVELAAVRTEQAADRTEAVVEKMTAKKTAAKRHTTRKK